MDALLVTELVLALTIGGGTRLVQSLGATSVVHSQPLVWMADRVARRNLAGRTLWWAVAGQRSGTLGGPVAIIKQQPTPPRTPPQLPRQPSPPAQPPASRSQQR